MRNETKIKVAVNDGRVQDTNDIQIQKRKLQSSSFCT